MSAVIEANAAQVIAVARSQLGITESPPFSNRQKYGAWYGMNGVAWCAMFVSWVFWHSGNPLPKITTAKGFAYCPEMVRHARETGQWRPVGTYPPKPGDIILFSFGRTRADHVAIVQGVLPDGRIHTVEGNTNAGGSRTGGGVYELNRRSSIMGFVEVRPKDAPAPPPVPSEEKDDDDMAATIRLNQPGHSQNGRVEQVTAMHRRWIPGNEYALFSFLGGQTINCDLAQFNAWTSNKQAVGTNPINGPIP